MASEAALAVFEETGHRYREGVMLTNLARIAMEQGRLDDALDGGRRALQLTEEIDDAEGVVASLQSLGDGYRLAGDHRTAREYLERGLEESRQHALPYFTAHLLASLAAVDLADGRDDDAVAHAVEAQEAASADDVPHAQARADLLTGMARQAAGDAVRRRAAARRGAAARRARGGGRPAGEPVGAGRRSGGRGRASRRDRGGRGDPARPVPGVYPGRRCSPGGCSPTSTGCWWTAGDPRADDVARRAGAYLQEQAERIRDDDLRASFLAAPVSVRLAKVAASAAGSRR